MKTELLKNNIYFQSNWQKRNFSVITTEMYTQNIKV